MNYDVIAGWVGLLVSVIVAVSGIVKAVGDRRKGLGDAFGAMQDALATLQGNYNQLRKDFDDLREVNRKSEIHRNALIGQLVEHRIPPITMEEAVKLSQKKGRTK